MTDTVCDESRIRHYAMSRGEATIAIDPSITLERRIVASTTLGTDSTADTQANRSLELALAAAQTALDNRGRDILILDLREVTCVFDYFVIATGTSRRQIHAMSEEIDHRLEDDLGDSRMSIEGYRESRWVLLDYGSVVIHLFEEETRDYYGLETLWANAKRIEFPAEQGTTEG